MATNNATNTSHPIAVTQGGTGLSSTTANQILYSSGANTIAGLSSANTGVLVTNGSGVPSISASTTSWTPAITFGGGNTGITYSQQLGQFYQLGQVVFFYFSMVLTAKGSSTGTMSITGLGAAGAPTPPQQAIFAVRCSNLTYTGMVNGRIAGGGLSIVLDAWASAGASAPLTDTAFANNTFVQGNGSYLIT